MTSKAELDTMFEQMDSSVGKEMDWYKPRKTGYMAFSVFLKISALLLFAFGSTLPTSGPFIGTPPEKLYQIALLSLAAAGVILTVDQIFLASQSWRRFAKAFVDLKILKSIVEFERKKFNLMSPSDVATPELLTNTLDVLSRLRADAAKIVQDETALWISEHKETDKALSDKISNALKALEQNKPASPNAGAIKLTVKGIPAQSLRSAFATVGSVKRTLTEPYEAPIAFTQVPVGLQTVTVEWTTIPDPTDEKKDVPHSREDVVDVKSGAIANCEISTT